LRNGLRGSSGPFFPGIALSFLGNWALFLVFSGVESAWFLMEDPFWRIFLMEDLLEELEGEEDQRRNSRTSFPFGLGKNDVI